MSGDQRPSSSSFGDAANAQPPTPKQTPTSGVFPSPVFETPKVGQGSFVDSGGWTPRFAEEYSVFNSTPGNLRGTDGPFYDFPPGQATSANRHKRLLSAEGFAVEIAAHANHFSNNNLPLPPVDPARRLPSSPGPLSAPVEYSNETAQPQPSPTFPNPQAQSAKKARRGTASEPEPPTQTATPPPTAHRGERRLAPKFTMQNDQSFGQPDFTGIPPQDLAALMAAGDMFSYPMSAPATASANFWDPSMSMDMDFAPSGNNVFQQPASNHRSMGSFDWNSDIQMFQDASAPVPMSSQDSMQLNRRERTLAPKPPVSCQGTTAATAAMTAAFAGPLDDPFGTMNPGAAVNPGLIFSRPPSSAMDMSFDTTAQTGTAEAAIAESGSRGSIGGDLRRTSSFKEAKNTKGPDRALAGSPVKSRPGLGRSFSENRGKKALGRGNLPTLAPAPQKSSSVNDNGRAMNRPSGRSSPLKSQHRLSSLASIPETSPQPRTRTVVKLTVDGRGRARAETTIRPSEPSIERDRSRHRSRELSDDESSTDDEPIIIPSRNTSFNASFALPDPRRPVGSIFHTSRRSISDRSTSTQDGPSGSQHDAESEAETIMNEQQDKGGDAASELRRVKEDRQRMSQMGSARSQRYLQTNLNSFQGNNHTVSPSSLTDTSLGMDRPNVRCICDRTTIDDDDGFVVQCESCEMLLHGRCVNINRQTLPRVYICAFCANTSNTRGGRMREAARGNLTMSTSSPLANRPFRSFR